MGRGPFFPDPACCLGCVCARPGSQALGLGEFAAAGLLASGGREDDLNPGCTANCACLLKFLGIEPLRDSACFLFLGVLKSRLKRMKTLSK